MEALAITDTYKVGTGRFTDGRGRFATFFAFVLLVLCLSAASETFDPSVLRKGYDQVTRGGYLNSQNVSLIGAEGGISFLECVEECLSRRRCLSVNYFTRSQFCQWNYQNGSKADLLTDREDAIFTNVTTDIWHPGLVEGCEGHICSMDQVCRRQPLNRIECAVSDCGPEPSLVENSVYELPDGISLGNRVFYTCRVGYLPNVDRRKMFGYCKKNGMWTIPQFQCLLVHCGHPPTIDNATPQLLSYNFSYNQKANYSCNAGHRLVVNGGGAEGYLQCEADGSWSSAGFHCEVEVESCDAIVSRDPSFIGRNGVYNISKDGITKQVYCEMSGGNWTVIQQREDDGLSPDLFLKTYAEYEEGFGTPGGDYWIGNDMLTRLTSAGDYELMMEILLAGGSSDNGHFRTFIVHSKTDKYRLEIGDELGSVYFTGKMVQFNNGVFHTNDQGSPSACSKNFFGDDTLSGGWWTSTNCELCFNCCRPDGAAKIQRGLNNDDRGTASKMLIRRKN